MDTEDLKEVVSEIQSVFWEAIERSYYLNSKSGGVARHHIESYNKFIKEDIPDLLENKHLVIELKEGNAKGLGTWHIIFQNVKIERPSFTEANDYKHIITPIECTWRNITYSSPLYVDMTIFFVKHGETEASCTEKNEAVYLAMIPVMVKSCLCHLENCTEQEMASYNEDIYDHGGYFVINGSRKILISQDQEAVNNLAIYKSTKIDKNFMFYAQIKSSSHTSIHATKTKVGYLRNNGIAVLIPYIPNKTFIPLGILLKAMGVKTDRQIFDLLTTGAPFLSVTDDTIKRIIEQTLEKSWERICPDQEQALIYIGKKGKKYEKPDLDPTESLQDSRLPEELDVETRFQRVPEPQKGVELPSDTSNESAYATYLLTKELFPHIYDTPGSYEKKIEYLCYIVRKLLLSIDVSASGITNKPYMLSERDNFKNKRVLVSGSIMKLQFYAAFSKLCKDVQRIAINSYKKGTGTTSMVSLFKPSVITNMMYSALSTNNWDKVCQLNDGVSQMFEQCNYVNIITNLTKVRTDIKCDSQRIIGPRKIINSLWGSFCPSETPEGKNVGLTKHLAFMARISTGEDPNYIKQLVLDILPNFKTGENITGGETIVLINGMIIDCIDQPTEFVTKIREYRRRGAIGYETSVTHNKSPKGEEDEIHILTDRGRIIRPLVIVENGKPLLTKQVVEEKNISHWIDYLKEGVVEYIDKTEEENIVVATSIEDLLSGDTIVYTHVEFHPSMILGVSASIIPYANHAPAPRITYGAAMMKQAAGIPFTNWRRQFNGTYNVLDYPQKPVCITKNAIITGYDAIPAGQNAVVAITPNEFNQEDSVIINQAAIDRGFLTITRMYNYYSDIRFDRNEVFGVPDPDTCAKLRSDYNHEKVLAMLDKEGIIKKGMRVTNGDILIGKMVCTKGKKMMPGQTKPYINDSVIYEHVFDAVVDGVQKGLNCDGHRYVRVCLAQHRPVDEGDKVSSMTAQKGTCGKVVRAEDMPFSSVTGNAPDILFNPLAIPSRMTINYLISAITGKEVCATSILNYIMFGAVRRDLFKSGSVDATAFDHKPEIMDQVYDELKKYGFNKYGNELMIDGMTGLPQKCLTYVGIVYYQRLRHMLVDKIHARARGVKTSLTRQPSEGRKHCGGLRLGVMERDNLHVHGGINLFKDRFLDNSDRFETWICGQCGLFAIVDEQGERRECKNCNIVDTPDQEPRLKKIVLPYATKLTMQELLAMNVCTKIVT
jgi:DNA-directed RNA polymerase beta subunit